MPPLSWQTTIHLSQQCACKIQQWIQKWRRRKLYLNMPPVVLVNMLMNKECRL
uniref:Uncharacterized protein n=1 Tax=Arundo donax TaxID=35708 RepID=A0A0A9CAA1_ARUDO